MEMSDNILHCFYSWGRKEYTEKCFNSLLKNKREQDRILVIDQEGHNIDYFKDKTDFLFVPKKNFLIGAVWMYIRNFINWNQEITNFYGSNRRLIFSGKEDIIWEPDFINVMESDAFGEDDWINKILQIFEYDEPIWIATGYDAPEHETMKDKTKYKIKKMTPVVQMMFKTENFMKLFTYLPLYAQDIEICEMSTKFGKYIGVINVIKHIGAVGKNEGFIK
jgi:hypothetical protein